MGIPRNAEYLLGLAHRFMVGTSEKEQANSELLAVATKSRLKAFLKGRLATFSQRGVDMAERFIGETPDEVKWKRERAKDLRAELERELDVAEELVEEARSLDPKVTIEDGITSDYVMAGIHYVRGSICADAGDLKDSLREFEKGLNIEPDQQLYGRYGSVLEEIGRLDEAIDSFGKAVDMDPMNELGMEAAMEVRRLQHYMRKK